MALERTEVVDAIEIRPLLKQIGVTKTITTTQDGEEVSKNAYSVYFSQEDDLSGEDTLVQSIANYYWSTL
jgi:hypothetical protein